MKPRAAFFVDGFNLYHSLAAFAKETGDDSVKWLDIVGLADGTLHEIGGGASLRSVNYFTAIPEHLYISDPGRLQRHRTYLRALTAHGSIRPTIILGRIAQQQLQISSAGGAVFGSLWREKGTDVALAMALLLEASKGDLDEAIIISGDADYLPAVRVFREMYPNVGLRFAFPRGRVSKELSREAPNSFTLTSAAYLSQRLPESIRLPSGKFLHCPAEWRRKAPMS
jgi:uncharacterized LabA/DUF88 family protein